MYLKEADSAPKVPVETKDTFCKGLQKYAKMENLPQKRAKGILLLISTMSQLPQDHHAGCWPCQLLSVPPNVLVAHQHTKVPNEGKP